MHEVCYFIIILLLIYIIVKQESFEDGAGSILKHLGDLEAKN